MTACKDYGMEKKISAITKNTFLNVHRESRIIELFLMHRFMSICVSREGSELPMGKGYYTIKEDIYV